jgi:hypothetical protein
MYLTNVSYVNSVTKMDKYIKYFEVMSDNFNVRTTTYFLYFEQKVPALRTAMKSFDNRHSLLWENEWKIASNMWHLFWHCQKNYHREKRWQ